MMSEPNTNPNNVPLSLNAANEEANQPHINPSPGVQGPDASRSGAVWIGVVVVAIVVIVAAILVSRYF